MTMEPLAIEFIDLSDAEARKIWHKQTKRAANFDKFLATLNARSVGAAFDLTIAKISGPDKSDEYAREVKHNFNEAAKERVEWIDVTAIVDQFMPRDVPANTTFHMDDGRTAVFNGFQWFAETPAPVVIRWKTSTHVEKRTVQDGKAKKEIDVTVVDSLHGLIVATDTVKKRGPRAAASEQVDTLVAALNPPADAKTATLADGRTATKTKAGHWRAPKLATAQSANGSQNTAESAPAASDSVDAAIRANGQTVETPVGAA